MDLRPQAQWLSDLRPPESLTPEADLLIINAGELVTMAGGPRTGARLKDAQVVRNGALAAYQGAIVDVGPTEEVLARVQTGPSTRIIDARGRAVIPGFVDPHTHLCFAGDRADEFAMRLQGATYVEIAAMGGGIMSTVKATRQATEPALTDLGLKRLDALALTGTTTVEVKSGYGLTTADELKQLRAIRQMAQRHPLDIVPTFMGAHELAPEYKQDRAGYIRLICEEMLPLVVAEGHEAGRPLAAFCDVFTEKGVFTVEESRRILQRGKQLGLRPKVHADELSDLGGALLAAEVGAVSADHLLFASEANLAAMAKAGVVAVCLPGTAFCLMNVPYANARRMIDLGCLVALASDYNPGSCPAYSMPFIITLACMHMQLDPTEALAAATINAAAAIGLEHRVGSLEVGKQADVVIMDAPSHRHIPYRMGQGLVTTVVKKGRLLVDDSRLVRGGR
ncbi:MAG TPA: imidazolonepropionase [Symbiobacteriaceae bacterium]|jgi:imidazolonepropionase|nr:imidazolonepropionase [Symbiobacteriaceae bacterium]